MKVENTVILECPRCGTKKDKITITKMLTKKIFKCDICGFGGEHHNWKNNLKKNRQVNT